MIDLKEIKNKTFKKENFYSLIIIFFIFIIDRYSKVLITNNFLDNTYYINDFLNLDLIWNTGIGFGLLRAESSTFYNLISFTIGLIILVLIFVSFKSERFEKFIFSLIVGGAIGNFYDRVMYNAVPDFIDLHYGSFHWFTFNVADIFITIGIIIYLLKEILIKK